MSCAPRTLDPGRDVAHLVPHCSYDGDKLYFLGVPVDGISLNEAERAILQGEDPFGRGLAPDRQVAMATMVANLHHKGLAVVWRSNEGHMPSSSAPRDLYVSPHADDVALPISGLLLAGLATRVPVILNVFSDSAWTVYPDAYPTRQARSDIRKAEDRLLAKLVHGEVRFLEFRESPYSQSADENARVREENKSQLPLLVAALRAELKAHAYDRILLPLGIGGHPDHLLALDAGLEVLAGGELESLEVIFYEDVPYIYEGPYELEGRLEYMRARGLEIERRCVGLDALIFERLQLAGLYRSQFGLDFLRRLRIYLRRQSLWMLPGRPLQPQDGNHYHECHWRLIR